MPIFQRLITFSACLLMASSPVASPTTSSPARSPPARRPSAHTLDLNIQVNRQGRQFLVDTGQAVVIASATSSDGDTVVVRKVFSPLGDELRVLLEPSSALYLSHRLQSPFDVIEFADTSKVQPGQRYAFNGVRLVNLGNGFPGYVSVYYDAPRGADQPVTVGLAAREQEQETLQPINHFGLQRFETRVIPVPDTAVLLLVAAGVQGGEVLPRRLLRPVGTETSVSTGGSPPTQPLADAPLLGNYLRIDSEHNVVHFDPSLNAFQYGPYPE